MTPTLMQALAGRMLNGRGVVVVVVIVTLWQLCTTDCRLAQHMQLQVTGVPCFARHFLSIIQGVSSEAVCTLQEALGLTAGHLLPKPCCKHWSDSPALQAPARCLNNDPTGRCNLDYGITYLLLLLVLLLLIMTLLTVSTLCSAALAPMYHISLPCTQV